MGRFLLRDYEDERGFKWNANDADFSGWARIFWKECLYLIVPWVHITNPLRSRVWVTLFPSWEGLGVCLLIMKRKIIPYNPHLKELARQLRNTSTKSEIILWQKLKRKQMYGYDFHRQKPIDNYILDFFCYELMLGIEVDGYSHEFLEVHNRDLVKEARMNEFGITVLRFSDWEVMKDT